jgi:hypothetical protein
MKKLFLSIIISLFSITWVFSHSEHYKDVNRLEYELFRNGKLIGFHNYDFKKNGNQLVVNSIVKFNIKKLGVNLYNYDATSEEIYENDQLIKFKSNTNQNKKVKYVNISYDADIEQLVIDGSSNKSNSSKDFVVGTWWNHSIVEAKSQISAISGRIIEQKVTFLGKEEIIIDNKKYNALRFNFSSADQTLPDSKKLNTDIWYDEKTKLWLKASFDKTGFWEYRLKNYK